jgi:hypothetical protein
MRLSLAALSALTIALPSKAQPVRPLTVRVRITDSLGVPLPDVDVSVVQGLNQSLARGATDRAGMRVMSVASHDGELQVVARRVGYQIGSKVFIGGAWRDTIVVPITMHRIPQRLDPVHVTAEYALRLQRQTIDADAIANSSRPLVDATDIIGKLRPDMIYGVGGRDQCDPVKNVFINGLPIDNPPINSMMEAKKADLEPKKLTRSADDDMPQRRVAKAGPIAIPTKIEVPGKVEYMRTTQVRTPYATLPIEVLSILATIKPEHIAFMEMRDCMDPTSPRWHGQGALLISLKEGVSYSRGFGTSVNGSHTVDSLLRANQLANAAEAESIERYRLRVLGVFDASGVALAGADVLDLTTGIRGITSETGTVALAFVLPGASRLVISKPGFKTDTLGIRISPADTMPITLLMRPAAP